jgi:hypothetical protein
VVSRTARTSGPQTADRRPPLPIAAVPFGLAPPAREEQNRTVRRVAHQLTVLIAIALTVTVAGGCGAGSSQRKSAPAARATQPRRPASAPPLAALAPPGSRPRSRRSIVFLRALRRVCPSTIARPSAVTSRRERAARLRREAERLAALAERLARLHPPAGAADLLRRYLDAVRAQISLDRRIARAIGRHDHDSEVVGTHQNDFNRQARSHLAIRLGVRCLRDVEPD